MKMVMRGGSDLFGGREMVISIPFLFQKRRSSITRKPCSLFCDLS